MGFRDISSPTETSRTFTTWVLCTLRTHISGNDNPIFAFFQLDDLVPKLVIKNWVRIGSETVKGSIQERRTAIWYRCCYHATQSNPIPFTSKSFVRILRTINFRALPDQPISITLAKLVVLCPFFGPAKTCEKQSWTHIPFLLFLPKIIELKSLNNRWLVHANIPTIFNWPPVAAYLRFFSRFL